MSNQSAAQAYYDNLNINLFSKKHNQEAEAELATVELALDSETEQTSATEQTPVEAPEVSIVEFDSAPEKDTNESLPIVAEQDSSQALIPSQANELSPVANDTPGVILNTAESLNADRREGVLTSGNQSAGTIQNASLIVNMAPGSTVVAAPQAINEVEPASKGQRIKSSIGDGVRMIGGTLIVIIIANLIYRFLISQGIITPLF